MLSTPFSDFNLRTFSPNVRRFYLFAVPIFSGLALFGLLFNLYLIRLGYREDFIGQLSGLFPLTSGILAVPTGILSDRIGRKPFLYATAVILGITQLALCLTTSSTWLLVACALGGSAGAFLFVNFVPFQQIVRKVTLCGLCEKKHFIKFRDLIQKVVWLCFS